MLCAKCGKELSEQAKFCPACGTKVQAPLEDKTPDASPEQEPERATQKSPEKNADIKDSVTVDPLEAAVGKKQTYYMKEFQKILSGGKPRFNWAAFLFGPAFCLYRKCGELFKKYFSISCALIWIGYLVEASGVPKLDFTLIAAGGAILTIGVVFQLVNIIRCGLQFNRAYLKHCQNPASSVPENAGVSMRNAVLFYVLYFLAILAAYLLALADVTAVSVVILGGLLWLFIRPYIMSFFLARKNHSGIRTNLAISQIAALLERTPWCESQIIREEGSIIPNTELRAQMYFKGIRAQVYFYIENGILHAYEEPVSKENKLRRLYLSHKEAQLLLQYIAILDGGDLEGASRLREKNAAVIKLRERYDLFDNICWLIAALLCVFLIFIQIFDISLPFTAKRSSTIPDAAPPSDSPGISVPKPEPETEPSAQTIDVKSLLGEYQMRESSAQQVVLRIYEDDSDGLIYLEGNADCNGYTEIVFGEVQEADDHSCFQVEDMVNRCRLDIVYDLETQALQIKEFRTGDVPTFNGTYVKIAPETFNPEKEDTPDKELSANIVSDALSEVMPPLIGIPGVESTYDWESEDVLLAHAVFEPVQSGAFTIEGYIDAILTRLDDGSWYAENWEDHTQVTYNYSGEYESEDGLQGVYLESEVTIQDGSAGIIVTPLDFTSESDPTGESVISWLEYGLAYDLPGTAYVWQASDGGVRVSLDENMLPIGFEF